MDQTLLRLLLEIFCALFAVALIGSVRALYLVREHTRAITITATGDSRVITEPKNTTQIEGVTASSEVEGEVTDKTSTTKLGNSTEEPELSEPSRPLSPIEIAPSAPDRYPTPDLVPAPVVAPDPPVAEHNTADPPSDVVFTHLLGGSADDDEDEAWARLAPSAQSPRPHQRQMTIPLKTFTPILVISNRT